MIAVVIPTRNLAYQSPQYRDFPTILIQDSRGEGFAKTCNRGLALAQKQKKKWVLICNDDAQIQEQDIHLLIARITDQIGVIGPVIMADQKIQSAGISVSRWGRLQLRNSITFRPPDALSGACFLVPSWIRFEDGYPHGFEDIALCFFLKKRGFTLSLVHDAICQHRGGGTLQHRTKDWYAFSIYGQLRLFSQYRNIPLILLLAMLQIKTDTEGWKGFRKALSMWKNQRFFTVT